MRLCCVTRIASILRACARAMPALLAGHANANQRFACCLFQSSDLQSRPLLRAVGERSRAGCTSSVLTKSVVLSALGPASAMRPSRGADGSMGAKVVVVDQADVAIVAFFG